MVFGRKLKKSHNLKLCYRLYGQEGDRRMEFIRIRTYGADGEFTGCEHLYFGNSQTKAIVRFRREYPEHNDCIVVAEAYNSEEQKNKEHFGACSRSGCVHYW